MGCGNAKQSDNVQAAGVMSTDGVLSLRRPTLSTRTSTMSSTEMVGVDDTLALERGNRAAIETQWMREATRILRDRDMGAVRAHYRAHRSVPKCTESIVAQPSIAAYAAEIYHVTKSSLTLPRRTSWVDPAGTAFVKIKMARSSVESSENGELTATPPLTARSGNDHDDTLLKRPSPLLFEYYPGCGQLRPGTLMPWLCSLPDRISRTAPEIGYDKIIVNKVVDRLMKCLQQFTSDVDVLVVHEDKLSEHRAQFQNGLIPAIRSAYNVHLPAGEFVEGVIAAYLYSDIMRTCDCVTDSQHELESEEHRKCSRVRPNSVVYGPSGNISAVMDWLMRQTARLRGSATNDIHLSGEAMLHNATRSALPIFDPLMRSLDMFLSVIPRRKEACIAQQAIPERMGHKYPEGRVIVWPCFSSTSVRDEDAKYALRDRIGTYFVIITRSGRDISFCTTRPQDGLTVLRPNTAFLVRWRMPLSLVHTLGWNVDVVILEEIEEEEGSVSPSDRIHAMYDAFLKTSFLYEPYLRYYTEARLHTVSLALSVSDSDAQTMLFDVLARWMYDAEQSKITQYILLLGVPGCGKTSASVGCASWLMNQCAAARHSGEVAEHRPWLPVVIPLSAVDGISDVEGALDRHVCEVLGLQSQEELELFGKTYGVILLLDSLHEIPAENRRWKISKYLLERNPWCATAPLLVILTSRDSFLSSARFDPPSEVLTSNRSRCETWHIYPLTDSDVEHFLAVRHKGYLMPRISGLKLSSELWRRPLLLDMLVMVLHPTLSQNDRDAEITTETAIYDRFVRRAIHEMVEATGSNLGRDGFRSALHRVALHMLDMKRWDISLAEVQLIVANTPIMNAMAAPNALCTIEDPLNPATRFRFRHKSVAEYLCSSGLLALSAGDRERVLRLAPPLLVVGVTKFVQSLSNRTGVDAIEALEAEAYRLIYNVTQDDEGAARIYERTLKMKEDLFGPFHVEVARTLDLLGMVYGRIRKFERQRDLLQRALRINEDYYGRDHLTVAMSRVHLAKAMGALHHHQQQRDLLEEALVTQEKQLGGGHIEVAMTLNCLGIAYGHLKQYPKKKELLRRALRISESLYGPNHISVSWSLCNLAAAYGELNDFDQKIKLLERARVIDENYYGPAHFEVANTLGNLAAAYGDVNNFVRQRELLLQALRIREGHFGTQHTSVALTLWQLGNVYQSLGDTVAWSQHLTLARDIYKKLNDPHAFLIDQTLSN